MGIIVIFILLVGFIFGPKQGGIIKIASSLIAHLIAIPLTGISYHLLASLFSFLPGDNWENFVGFFSTKYLIIGILYFVFLFLSRRFIQKDWKKGIFFRLIGGMLSALNSAMGMVTLVLVVEAYPFSGWFEQVVLGSSVLNWLVTNLSFVREMLPFA